MKNKKCRRCNYGKQTDISDVQLCESCHEMFEVRQLRVKWSIKKGHYLAAMTEILEFINYSTDQKWIGVLTTLSQLHNALILVDEKFKYLPNKLTDFSCQIQNEIRDKYKDVEHVQAMLKPLYEVECIKDRSDLRFEGLEG